MEDKIKYLECLRRADITAGQIYNMTEQSLLIGNGDINALLYRIEDEIVFNLTKNDIWDSRLDTENDPPLVPTRELEQRMEELQNGKEDPWLKDTIEKSNGAIDGYRLHPYPCPIICARVRIKTGSIQKEESHRLSLEDACIYSHLKKDVNLSTFAHAEENIFIIHGITPELDIYLEPLQHIDMQAAQTGTQKNMHYITQEIPGDLDISSMRYSVVLKRYIERNMACVVIVSSKEAEDPMGLAEQFLKKIDYLTNIDLTRTHNAWWQKFWSSSGIKIDDAFLESLWYRNLYFLACVSRSGKICPGLFAGLVSDQPDWHGDYHLNYNLQQVFWGAYASNHTDLSDPYDELIIGYLPRAKWLSKILFDVEGAFYPLVAFLDEPKEPESCKSKNGRQFFQNTWGRTLGLAAFCVQNLWWHYLYTRDLELLKKIYPTMKEVAEFYSRWGKFSPTVSPEHWGITIGFEKNSNGTFDIAMIKYIMKAAIKANAIMNDDVSLRISWEKYLDSLPEYPVTKEDQPIIVDVEGAPPIDDYNIPVPAFPAFPGEDITEENRELLTRTVERMKTWEGNDMVMTAMAKIRLNMENAYEHLRVTALRRNNENGSLNMMPYQHKYNGNGLYTEMFGVVMPINELLIQSHDGAVRLFPVWPRHMNAEFEDLRTVGAFLISAALKDGRVGDVLIKSLAGGSLRMEKEWEKFVVVEEDGEEVACALSGGDVLSFETEKDKIYRIISA